MSHASGLYRRVLPLAIVAVLAVLGSMLLLPAQGARAYETFPEFTFSISGSDGAAYLHGGNGTRNANATVDQEWNAGTGGDYESIQAIITGTNGSSYDVEFATPNGSNQHFADGYYPWAEDWPLSPGRPGIIVTGGPNPCGTNFGSFEIRDIARAANGDITRLDVVFTRYCGSYGSGQVDTGELKFGYPQTAYEVSQGEVAWPETTVYPGQSAPDEHPVDLRLTSSKTVTVSKPSVTGADAADFPIRSQNCTGTLTVTGCTVWVGFTPKARGPRHAQLIVPTSAGSASVSLDGLGAVGTSTWTVNTNWPGTPTQEVIPSVSAGDQYSVISQGLQPIPGTQDATLWTARFADTQGLKPGTTYTYKNVVPPPPFTMSISQGDVGCEMGTGSVTVYDLATVGPDHLLSRLDALLKATCPYSVDVRMRFHEAADLTPPGPVTGLKAVRSGSTVTLTWTKPAVTDLAGIIIRWYSSASAPGAWFTGNFAYQGTGTTASFSAPATQPVSVSAWTYDTTGNVSTASSVHLP